TLPPKPGSRTTAWKWRVKPTCDGMIGHAIEAAPLPFVVKVVRMTKPPTSTVPHGTTVVAVCVPVNRMPNEFGLKPLAVISNAPVSIDGQLVHPVTPTVACEPISPVPYDDGLPPDAGTMR